MPRGETGGAYPPRDLVQSMQDIGCKEMYVGELCCDVLLSYVNYIYGLTRR